jgi:hypothetical protein
MLATATQTVTERDRFRQFIATGCDAAALLAHAEATRDPVAFGVLADELTACGEDAWAEFFRVCVGEEWAIVVDGSTYNVRAVSGARPGKTVYMIQRMSPRMRNSFGEIDYAHSAADLVSYLTVVRQRAEAKHGRKAKEREAKASARKGPNPFAVGDILHYSYGYDATINNYAEVVAVSGQTVTYRPIRAEQVGEGWATGCKVRPVPGSFNGPAATVRLAYSARGDNVSVSLPVADHKGKQWRKVSADSEAYETDNR